MPFRLDEHRAKVQFVTYAAMPMEINRACLAKSIPSQTRYVQEAVCKKLSEDLGIPYESLLARLPPARGMATVLFGDDHKILKRPRATVDEVR